MNQPGEIIVAPSLPRFLGRLVLLPVGLAVALWALVGVGTILYVAVAGAMVLSAVCFAAMAVSQRPRVVITSEGFAFHKLIGGLSHTWDEIDGPFAVIQIGLIKAVGYKLTAEYRARVGRKPTTRLSGYDDAVMGAFQLSAEELAGLLNDHKGRNAAEAEHRPPADRPLP